MPQTSANAPSLRTLDGFDDLRAWTRAAAVGFFRAPDVTDEEVKARTGEFDLSRTQGAFDGGRCVATFRTFPHELTVPGGAAVTTCAVSAVTVSPTHRRRGLLTRMMRGALDAAKERGEAAADLIAAEHRIYGRFGFGPAAWAKDFEVDVARSGIDPRHWGPDDGGRIDLAEPSEIREAGPAVHERLRHAPQSQGLIDRPARWWQVHTGALRHPDDGFTPPFHAVYRDAGGTPQGVVAYTVKDHWDSGLPACIAEVRDLVAATPGAERALWHFVFSLDWVSRVRAGLRAADDLLPQLLPDPRAAHVRGENDWLWLRPLDVPRLLEARSYPAEGTLVLDVHDEDGYAAGRWRLDAGPDGARCTPARESADVSLGAGELGAVYLGDASLTRLRAVGRADEHVPGAAAKADALLRTARRPWCPDSF